MSDHIKSFYTKHHDTIYDKRYHSPYWTRRYAHRQIHAQFLPYLQPGQQVLDVGCGEGVLSSMAARQGVRVLGSELSWPNLEGAQQVADEWNVSVTFLQSDAENLPFADNSFDVVLSSHVLEHLPHLNCGLRELYRVTRSLALIAMPTCLNPACWTLLGGSNYYHFSRRSPVALPLGIARTVGALLRGQEGPDETYGGSNVPHIWRFPWVMRRLIREAGFRIERFEAGPLIVPYVGEYLPWIRKMQPHIDRLRAWPLVRNFGYGSMAVCRK